MEIKVINIRNYEGTDYIYIGRDFNTIGKYGNPFSSKDSNIAITVESKEESLRKFEKYIDDNPSVITELYNELKNNQVTKLGCWCKSSNGTGRCHGDIYIKKLKEKLYKSII